MITVPCMHLQICTGILVAFIIGLPYASEDLYSVHILHSKVGWWRVMLATAVLPALCQVDRYAAAYSLCLWLAENSTAP